MKTLKSASVRFLAAILLSVTTPAFAEAHPLWVAPYLSIQSTLAKDSIAGVPAAGKELAQALTKTGQLKAASLASPLESAKTIAEFRDGFQKLSDLLLPKMKGVVKGQAKKASTPLLILAYCPMKKAYWLQAKGDLRNPYYGAEMLECGVEEELK